VHLRNRGESRFEVVEPLHLRRQQDPRPVSRLNGLSASAFRDDPIATRGLDTDVQRRGIDERWKRSIPETARHLAEGCLAEGAFLNHARVLRKSKTSSR
jgi:hypothetical protein